MIGADEYIRSEHPHDIDRHETLPRDFLEYVPMPTSQRSAPPSAARRRRLNALRSIGFAIAFGHPLRLGGGRAARAGRAPELSRSPDAGLDEVLGDARHPGHRPRGELGAILALFKWVYAFLSPIGGYLADRYSRRHVIAGSLFVWSLVTWTTGHVTTYEQLLVTRALMGISEAFYIPAALALIADFHTGPTRSRAVGPSDGDLRRRHDRRVRRLCGGQS